MNFSPSHQGAPDYEYDPADYYNDLEIYMERLLKDLFIMHYQENSDWMRKNLYKMAELRKWNDILPTLNQINDVN